MKQTWPPLAELSSALQKKRLMDSVDVCAATSTADNNNKRRVHPRSRGEWLNRLHLRKAALPPPAMQSPDKHGPKKITATAEKRASTTWPPSKKRPNHEELQRTIHGGNALRFRCSQCADAVERAPKDLLKHFEEKHKGCPPVFSCHMCKFTTHELSYLQVHVLSHKDTFSCCSLCKDNVQRTWAEFSTHLTMVHTQNGKYTCEVCQKFSTSDDKEFLEHVLLHNLGLDMKSEQAIGKMATHKCQFCGFEASQKVHFTKHMKAIHGNDLNCSKSISDGNAFSMTEPKVKPKKTRSAVKDLSWLTQDCLSLPGREFLDKYCHLSDAKTTLEDTEQFLMKSSKQRWSKALKNVLSNVPQDVNLPSKLENGLVSVSPDSSQDVLTVKNKINQNGTSFVKRLRMMTDKESADADSCEKMVSAASLSECLQNQEIKLSSDVLMAESTEGPSAEENRENHRLKRRLNERHAEEAIQDGAVTNELKAEERKVVRKALPKKKRKNMRWKNMKKKSKKPHNIQTLKIVLKKIPKSRKQWVTQTSQTSQSKCNSTTDETKTCSKTDEDGTTDCGQIPNGGSLLESDGGALVTRRRSEDNSEVGADLGGSEAKTRPDGSTESSLLAQPVITAHIETEPPAVCPSIDRTRDAHPTDSSLCSSASDSSPSPPPPPLTWTATPKTQERTLHLVALRPDQAVKRPSGSQPVVVLNHPDTDVPEVSRIMEVVKKYKGEIHKVVLSKRTLSAIDGHGDGPVTDGDALTSPLRERFMLKLKLRRLSRKKFEVVYSDAVQAEGQTFRCWFCGRVFVNRQMWLSHRQRHLLEWKSPNCENS